MFFVNFIKIFLKKMVFWILIITLVTLFFSCLMGVRYKEYSLYPLTRGFCNYDKQGFPQFLILCIYYIFVPVSLHEIIGLGGSHYSLKISFIISLVVSYIFFIIHYVVIILLNYRCLPIFKHIPYDIFYTLASVVFSFMQIFRPLLKLLYSKHAMKKLDLTKNGLLHVLDDKILNEEFMDYCLNMRCVEYALFHTEYKKFMNLFEHKAITEKQHKNYNNPNYLNSTNTSNTTSTNFSNSNKNINYSQNDEKKPIKKSNTVEEDNDSTITEANSVINYSYTSWNDNTSYVTVDIKSKDPKLNNSARNISKIASTNIPSAQYYEKLACISDVNSNSSYNTYSYSNTNSNINVSNGISNNKFDSDNDEEKLTINDLDAMTNEKIAALQQKASRKKKIFSRYEAIYKQLNYMYEYFLLPNSDFELNLPDSISKSVRKNVESFNEHYMRFKSRRPYVREKLFCKHIFDEAHDEAIEMLYLNLYSSFVLLKKKFNEDYDDNIDIRTN